MKSDYGKMIEAIEQEIEEGYCCPLCASTLLKDDDGTISCSDCNYVKKD